MTTKYEAYPSLKLYDRLGVPYVLTSEPWGGPLWTGHCMMLSTTDCYGDEGFLHELMHWVEASVKQRRYPDLALGRWVNARYTDETEFASSTSPHYLHRQNDPPPVVQTNKQNPGWGENTVPLKEADRQESNACHGMFFYHALVGNTTWAKPKQAGAAWDFTGDRPSARTVATASQNIIATLSNRSISPETAEKYAASVLSDSC